MSSIEDDITSVRERLAKTEAELRRHRGWNRIILVMIGFILLLIAPGPVILTLVLGVIVLGGYAIVSFLSWMNESVNDIGRSRREATDADQPPAVDSPPG